MQLSSSSAVTLRTEPGLLAPVVRGREPRGELGACGIAMPEVSGDAVTVVPETVRSPVLLNSGLSIVSELDGPAVTSRSGGNSERHAFGVRWCDGSLRAAVQPCLAPDRQAAAPLGTRRALRAGGG